MREQKPPGPERITPLERFIGLLHLPYGIACFVLAALIGPPAGFLAAYLNSFDLEEAIRSSFTTTYSLVPTTISALEGFRDAVLWFAGLFVFLYLTRFMRLKLLSSEEELTSLAPQGEETLHKAFGGVSRSLPVALLTAAFYVQGLLYFFAQDIVNTLRVYGIISGLVSSFVYASFLWVYFRSLWGLHLLGREPLKLKSYYEDAMLGLKRVGTIALWLAFAFFAAAGLGTVGVLVSPDPLLTILLSITVLFGVIMFFLPLNSIHRQMQKAKRLQQASVRGRFAQILNGTNPHPSSEILLTRISQLQTLQLAKDDAARMPTWPFDTSILSRFAAIILSVTAIILARIIMTAVGI